MGAYDIIVVEMGQQVKWVGAEEEGMERMDKYINSLQRVAVSRVYLLRHSATRQIMYCFIT